MSDNETLEIKLNFLTEEVKEIKEMVAELRSDEKKRLQAYNDSNTQLAIIADRLTTTINRVDKIEHQATEKPRNTAMWIAIAISVTSLVLSVILKLL